MQTPARLSVFAANTNLGKTILSAALCRGASIALSHSQVAYIKPVQTGFPADSDSRFVASFSPGIQASTLFTYTDPVSPHLAAIIEKRPLSDDILLQSIQHAIQSSINRMTPNKPGFVLVETAGGVLSPTASGALQSDVYKSLAIRTALVGDSNLGGISTTLTSYEALRSRGFSVPLLIMFDNAKYANHDIIRSNVDSKTSVVVVPSPPEKNTEPNQDQSNLIKYFESIDGIMSETIHRLWSFSSIEK